LPRRCRLRRGDQRHAGRGRNEPSEAGKSETQNHVATDRARRHHREGIGTMILKDEIDKAGAVVDRLNAAIRDNPLAAGLIGAGVAWMLFGGAKGFGVMAGVAKGAAVKTGSAVAAAGNTMARAGSAVAGGVKNAASDLAGSVASIVPDLPVP